MEGTEGQMDWTDAFLRVFRRTEGFDRGFLGGDRRHFVGGDDRNLLFLHLGGKTDSGQRDYGAFQKLLVFSYILAISESRSTTATFSSFNEDLLKFISRTEILTWIIDFEQNANS